MVEEEQLPDLSAAPIVLPVKERPRKLLVAEDEHLVAVNLVEHLNKLGYETRGPAVNGRDAIELAKQSRPDMAVLDVRMPEVDGLSAAQVLFCQMGIPVVIVSAFSDPDYLAAGARIGVFGYLLKPVTPDDLRVNITIAWARFQHHCKLREQVRELKTTLESRKIIEKAKGMLMQKMGLTEDAAMKRLQKLARDRRKKLVDTAQSILDAADLLGT